MDSKVREKRVLSRHGPNKLFVTPQTYGPNKTISVHELASKYANATLGSGNLRDVVKLPHGVDRNEWLAANSKKEVL
jgi:hypothetical protein